MALIDIDKLTAQISPDEPCGPDLSYDAEYFTFMQAAEGTPPQVMGDSVIEGVEPNWRDVKSQAIDLLGRSKDLSVTMVLLNALLCLHGLPGLRDGLELLKKMLQEHWENLHPKLDPDDNNDPLERMNLVAALAAPPGADGDPRRFQQRLREAPLASSRQLGSYGLRHILIATGEIKPPADMDSVPDMAVIDGAFADTDPEELRAIGEAAQEAGELSREIDDWLTKKVGAGNAADLSSWHASLKSVNGLMKEQLSKRGLLGEEAAAEAEAEEGTAPAAAGGVAGAGPRISGNIQTRDDVLTALGKILEYYQRHEPSSPVPLLIRRAQRLASMSFVDIIRDLSPSAIEQIRVIGGEDAMNSPGPVPSPAPPPATGSAPPPAASPAKASTSSSGGGSVKLTGF